MNNVAKMRQAVSKDKRTLATFPHHHDGFHFYRRKFPAIPPYLKSNQRVIGSS